MFDMRILRATRSIEKGNSNIASSCSQGKLPAILLPEIQFDGLPRVDSSVQSRDPVQVHELRR